MIFCFSGTGNSLWVAQRLADSLGDKIYSIADRSSAPIKSAAERVIWVFPIYSWGLPPVVKQFIKSLCVDFQNQPHHYMVCTCGDDIGVAHKQWRKMITKRGWIAHSAFSVQMPNTYTLMKGFDVDSKEIIQQKLDAAPERVNYIVQQIRLNSCTDNVTTGSWAWIKTHIIYPYFMKFCTSPKPFLATENCISCNKCVKECPLLNITIHNNRPKWGNNCTLCLRCYHTCPQHAIAYGKATKGKGQYLHP